MIESMPKFTEIEALDYRRHFLLHALAEFTTGRGMLNRKDL